VGAIRRKSREARRGATRGAQGEEETEETMVRGLIGAMWITVDVVVHNAAAGYF